MLSRPYDEEFRDRVRAYQDTDAYHKARRKRSVWVEPLFAEAKDWHGLRRCRLRRLWRVWTPCHPSAPPAKLFSRRRAPGPLLLPSSALLTSQRHFSTRCAVSTNDADATCCCLSRSLVVVHSSWLYPFQETSNSCAIRFPRRSAGSSRPPVR